MFHRTLVGEVTVTMIGLRGRGCEWSGGDMHRGGGLGEGTDDLGPEPARRGKHRRREHKAREQPPGSEQRPESRSGGRVGVTYKYFGAPDGATAARVPISMRPEELGGDELGMGGMFTKIKPETIAAMVLTGIQGMPLHKVPHWNWSSCTPTTPWSNSR